MVNLSQLCELGGVVCVIGNIILAGLSVLQAWPGDGTRRVNTNHHITETDKNQLIEQQHCFLLLFYAATYAYYNKFSFYTLF